MKCPYCAHLGDKVVDSRESKEGEVIRRRRECLGCGKRFTSYERIDEIPYMAVKKDGTPLSEGYIALQGESHPTEFRKVEILNLSGCMDPKAKNYKTYFVHRDDSGCVYDKKK